LGEALLRAVFGELYSRGLRRVGLGVDAENETGALSLYKRVGLRPVSRGDNWVLDL
jgi:ribosomal protein S18 acetylase RimI-like enzyme